MSVVMFVIKQNKPGTLFLLVIQRRVDLLLEYIVICGVIIIELLTGAVIIFSVLWMIIVRRSGCFS